MTNSRRTLLVISNLKRGGAEKNISLLANALVDTGHEVSMVTLFDDDGDQYYLKPGIDRIRLRVRLPPRTIQYVAGYVRSIGRLRTVVKRTDPGTVISFLDRINILSLLATRGIEIKTVVCERNNPAKRQINGFWKALRRVLYPRATALVTQTTRMASHFSFMKRSQIEVIPNLVEPRCSIPGIDSGGSSNHIASVGRLVPQKGFDMLIESFRRVVDRYPGWTLSIAGEGPERANLEALIRKLKLQDSVTLVGQVADVFRFLNHAELFVMSSRFEGFPNALCEAMSAGVASVSFDCDSGPADIITHGVDGLLVPEGDTIQLADAICSLISDEPLRKRLAHNGRAIVTRLGPESIKETWTTLLESLHTEDRESTT